MKNILTLFLALFILASLTACKNTDVEDAPETDFLASYKPTAPVESEVAEVKDIVLVDNETCTFEIKRFENEDEQSFAMSVFVRNNASEILEFSVDDVSLNGYMCDPYWTETFEPGESRETIISWYETILRQSGISDVEIVEFTLVAKSVSSEESVFNETFKILPLGGDVEALALDKRPEIPGEIVLADSDEFFFSITGFDLESSFEYALGAYIENHSDMNYFVTVDKMLVNGQPCDPYWAVTLPAGRRAHALISWLDFYPYNIDAVEDLEFTIKVYDADNWVAPPVYIKNVSVSAD